MAETIGVLRVGDAQDFPERVAPSSKAGEGRFEAETVSRAETALELLSTEEYSCIVSDYELPDASGIEFLQSVRDRWPDLPFVLFTDDGNEAVASAAISAGVTDYFRKEADPDQHELLATRIENAAEQYRANQRLKRERRRFRTLFDRLSQPIVEVDYDANDPIVKRVNSAFEETFGYDEDAIVGESLDSYIIPDDRLDEAETLNEELQATGQLDAREVTRKTADGPRQFLLQTTVYDDEPSGFLIYTDVTERHEREQELERSQDLLSHTEQLAGVGGWEVDVDTGSQRWTQGTYAIHDIDPAAGFDPTVADGIEFYHSDDQATIEEAVERCRSQGEPYEHELRVITADGEQKWVHTKGEPVYDGDDIVKIRGAIRDITARKRRERELQRYERLIELSPDLLVVMDEAMTIEYQSPSSPLTDWSPLDTEGETPLDFIHPDDRDAVLEHFERVVEHPETIDTIELRSEHADGSYQWIESRAQNFLNHDRVDGILAVLHRITQRKRQEQRLEQYNDALEQLQTTTQTLLETTDTEAAATRAIESFESVFDFTIAGIWHYSPEQDVLSPVAVSDAGEDLVSEVPQYDAATESLSWDAYQQQELRYIAEMAEHENRLNPNTEIQSEVIAPLGEYGLLNIGAAKPDAFTEFEIDLIELWVDTLTGVFARISQLDLLKDREAELRRERDRLDDFASVISHDLRNPLNVATARTELALQDGDTHHLEDVTWALERMEDLVDDLLFLARQGDTVGTREEITLQDVVADCWRNVETTEASLAVDGTATLDADRSRMTQIFENLFRNAIEHGGEEVRISVGVLADRGFYVADDGPGIPDADLDAVFDSGFTTQENGTGFGLTIVEEICEAHGWQIAVTENSMGGARFEITDVDSLTRPQP